MRDTVMVALDLSEAQGLETVTHRGPSSIGTDTMVLSKAKIPKVFLRGAGVPEPLILQIKSLKEYEFYSCFISYASEDDEFVGRLYADLQSNHVRCWYAPEHLKTGDEFRQIIEEEIFGRDKLLLVLTTDSLKSPWVKKEVETAFEKEQKQKRTVLFPIQLDDAVMDAPEAWAGGHPPNASHRGLPRLGESQQISNRLQAVTA
jgi:TIR domain